GESLATRAADELADLLRVEQQLAGARGRRVVVAARQIGGDGESLEPDLAVAHVRVGLTQTRPPRAQRLDFRSREHEAGLPRLQVDQYRGNAGSTFTAHASIPPRKLRTFEKPAALRISSALSERAPWWQCVTISWCPSSSPSRSGSSPNGMSTAPPMCAISCSCGSRTSITTRSGLRPHSSRSSCAVISAPSYDGSAPMPQNAS